MVWTRIGTGLAEVINVFAHVKANRDAPCIPLNHFISGTVHATLLLCNSNLLSSSKLSCAGRAWPLQFVSDPPSALVNRSDPTISCYILPANWDKFKVQSSKLMPHEAKITVHNLTRNVVHK